MESRFSNARSFSMRRGDRRRSQEPRRVDLIYIGLNIVLANIDAAPAPPIRNKLSHRRVIFVARTRATREAIPIGDLF